MNEKREVELKKHMELEKALYEYAGEDRVLPSEEVYTGIKAQNKNKVELLTRLREVDKALWGILGGELNVVSGLTGQGKTLFCQTLTKNFNDWGHKSLWFTYEVPVQQFCEQFDGPLERMYLPNILRSNSLDWIRNRIWEAKLKYGVEAIFVDHLHFIADVMMKRNPSLEIGQVMRQVKRWALEFNVAFFLIAHTTKIKADTELDLGDTRDSSFIEQEADNVFYIWRKKDFANESTLKIAKNRRRGVFNKKIALIKEGLYLEEKA